MASKRGGPAARRVPGSASHSSARRRRRARLGGLEPSGLRLRRGPDVHEHDRPGGGIEGHEVDLASAGPRAAGEDPQAPPAQVGLGLRAAGAGGCWPVDPLCRHADDARSRCAALRPVSVPARAQERAEGDAGPLKGSGGRTIGPPPGRRQTRRIQVRVQSPARAAGAGGSPVPQLLSGGGTPGRRAGLSIVHKAY